MTIVEKLTSLGFSNAETIGEAKGKTAVRVRTSRGWVYERFANDDAVDRWANFHQPESEE